MLDQGEARAALQGVLLAAARPGGWLTHQRWYADKGREAAASELLALRLEPAPAGSLALAVVQLRFTDRGVSRYFVPLFLGELTASDESPLGRVGDQTVYDATPLSWFGEWLLQAFRPREDDWPVTLGPAGPEYLDRASGHSPRVLQGEQSNTSLRFDDAIIVKLFRKLQPGVNPDAEALRVLSQQGFHHAPAFVGQLAWPAPGGQEYPVALATAFVAHRSDGWSWLLARLGDHPGDAVWDLSAEQLLGRRTAEMHLALAAAADAAFVPRPATAEEIAVCEQRTRAALADAVAIIRAQAESLPPEMQANLPQILAALERSASALAGYAAELGLPRIRTHGDYHLGQTLRTDDDWVILDFEGEPARPVEQRRERTSALKDVAGMLRSFAYARGAAALAVPEPSRAGVDAQLHAWEQAARAAFLAAYRQALADAGADLVARDEAKFTRALRAWELDKALYEVAYEARNRPSWLGIPLATLTTA